METTTKNWDKKHDGVSLLNTFSEIVAKKLQILKRKYPVANVLTKIFSHEILLRDIWNIIIFPWKISLNAVNFIRKRAKKKQISFLWRILDPNWVHLMIEKRAKEVQKFYFKFLRSNWIKFQIAYISSMVFFCYFSNKIFVKMMEIPPGNIDHFELKCRSLQEVKKYFSNGRIGLDVQKKYKFPTW